jgi:hypothetical protein
MNLLELFKSLTRGRQIMLGVIIPIILMASCFIAGRIGNSFGESRASKRFEELLTEKQKALETALNERDRFKAEATRLQGQNELLRQQEEATAEVLRANDKRLAGDSAKLQKLNEERKANYEKIENFVDVNHRRCDVCDDYARAGFKLSAEFCNQCQRK